MSPLKKTSEACEKLAKYRRQETEQQAEDGDGALSDTEQAAAATKKVLDVLALCQSTLTTKIENRCIPHQTESVHPLGPCGRDPH